MPAGHSALAEQSHAERRGIDDAYTVLLEESCIVGQRIVVQRVVAEVQYALHTLAALDDPFQVLKLQVGDAHVAYHPLVAQLKQRRQCLVHHLLQSARQCCLELYVVDVYQVDVVNAQPLHALVDAVGHPLGRVVPGVHAVLAIASHLGAQVVFVTRYIPQCLAQHRLGLVVAVVGTHVDEVNTTLDGCFHSLETLFLVGLTKDAAQ